MAAMTGPLVAVDWGTSSLRGALIAADGTVREERSDARGILAVPAGGFPRCSSSCSATGCASAARAA